MKLAIVHDYLNQRGGAERCVIALHGLFPDAPIFTSFYIKDQTFEEFKTADISTTYMQKLPFVNKYFRHYLPFYPGAFKKMNLDGYDVVLSSSSAWAKGVVVKPDTVHICYCYTPMRSAWDFENYTRDLITNKLVLKILKSYTEKLKIWDIKTSRNVDYFIAISKVVSERIKRIYGRDSTVIYPPVETKKFKLSDEVEDYFLVVSRLNSYKRVDLAIKACNELNRLLIVVGDGPHKKELHKFAAKNIKFYSKISDTELVRLYSKCKALIFTGEEDFGIAPVEAMASGRPVIAFQSGGATETVVDGKTGLFFKHQNVDSLTEAINRFNEKDFNPAEIQKHSKNFDTDIFKRKIKKFISDKCDSK